MGCIVEEANPTSIDAVRAWLTLRAWQAGSGSGV
jgi:hypothetical protein